LLRAAITSSAVRGLAGAGQDELHQGHPRGRVAIVELGAADTAGQLADPHHVFMATDTELDVLVLDPSLIADEAGRPGPALAGAGRPGGALFIDGTAGDVPPLSSLPHRRDRKPDLAEPGEC